MLPREVVIKLGSLPFLFIKVVIIPANLINSLFNRLPLFKLSLGLGALAIDFMVIVFLLFWLMLVILG